MEEEEIELLSDDELAKFFVGDAFSMYMKEVFSYRLLSMDEKIKDKGLEIKTKKKD